MAASANDALVVVEHRGTLDLVGEGAALLRAIEVLNQGEDALGGGRGALQREDDASREGPRRDGGRVRAPSLED